MSMREEFESWLGREAFTERSDSGKYVSAHIDAMWNAWQSAYAAGLEVAAKVCEAMHDEDRPGDYAYAIRCLKTQAPA